MSISVLHNVHEVQIDGQTKQVVLPAQAHVVEGVAETVHAHAPGDVTGTAVVTSDARLSDARTPTTHSHAESDVTGLASDLAAKEAANANLQTHVTGTGSPHTAAGVGAEASGAVATHDGLATVHASATTIGGKAIPSAGFEPLSAAIQTHIGGTGSPHTAAGVGAEASGAVATHNGLATVHASATTIGGKALPSGTIEDTTGSAGKVSTHAALLTAHHAASATPATSGTQAVTPGSVDVYTITPTGACTFNSTGGTAGQRCTFSILTSGTSAFVLTFGTNFKSAGTLSTGTVTGKYFCVSFVCRDGTLWVETGRTAAM